MKAFGPPHAHHSLEVCPTPVGKPCLHCEEKFVEGDQGFMMDCSHEIDPSGEVGQHRECQFRTLFGSVGHQQKKCSCFGGTEEDPPNMTPREAAKAAMDLHDKIWRRTEREEHEQRIEDQQA